MLPVSKNRPKPLCLNVRITRLTVTYCVTDNKPVKDRHAPSRRERISADNWGEQQKLAPPMNGL